MGPEQGKGLEAASVRRIAQELEQLRQRGVKLGVVVGGGNFLRGRDVDFLDRISADHIGMLSTVLNGLALQAVLEQRGVDCQIQSALPVAFTIPINPKQARQALAEGKVVIFVAGTGNPLVSTDTAAAIRAVEIGAELLLKATYVDGVYDQDPAQDPNAKRFERLTFAEVIERRLNVMDLAAFDLCRQHSIPILVFDVQVPGNLNQSISDASIGTLIV